MNSGMLAIDWAATTRNICLMHLLERLATRFNEAGIPLMVLKGAALHLTLYQRPEERPMDDIDLLVRPEHAEPAVALLAELGCRRGEPLVREDFFPRFYYETEFVTGDVFPMRIDLHVRPLRPLRYGQLLPDNAFWQRARPVPIGQATVLVPAADDMLIHLATHAAIHGFVRPRWLEEIKRWADAWRAELDWQRLVATAESWRLALPVRQAIARAQREFGACCPASVLEGLTRVQVNWRDRLALWHAPRDAEHLAGHVLVNMLCTPGWRFVLAYLLAVLLPDRAHMGQWYRHRHWGWLSLAHVARCFGPLTRAAALAWKRLASVVGGHSAARNVRIMLPRQAG